MTLDIYGVPSTGGIKQLTQKQNPVMLLLSSDTSNLNNSDSNNPVLWDTNVFLPLGFLHDTSTRTGIVTVNFSGLLMTSCQLSMTHSGSSSNRYVGNLKMTKNGSVIRQIENQGFCQNALGSFGCSMQLGPVPISVVSGDNLAMFIDRALNVVSSFLKMIAGESYWTMYYLNKGS